MKNSIILLTIALALFSSCKKKAEKPITIEQQKVVAKKLEPKFEMLWETDSVFKTPESCVFDADRNQIYVSNVNMNPRKKDNNGFISTIGQDSKLNLKWVTGLSAPKGMGLYKDILYVTDIDALVEIDVNAGKIIKKHTVEGAVMLNDISVDPKDGTVYFSAMDTNKIYMLKDGKVKLWKENLNKPNGLLVDGDLLLVASFGDGTLKAYHKNTNEMVGLYASGLGKADGVVKLNFGNYMVSDWRGEIFLVEQGKTTSLYNSIEDKTQTADIGIIPGQDVVLIPTFFGNRVKAYRFIEE